MEDRGSSSSRSFARFPELASFMMHLTTREDVRDFCDGKGDEGFTTLTKVGSQVAYGAVVDPYPIRFVSSCMTYITRRQGANVSEAPVGLPMPVSGFTKPDSLYIV